MEGWDLYVPCAQFDKLHGDLFTCCPHPEMPGGASVFCGIGTFQCLFVAVLWGILIVCFVLLTLLHSFIFKVPLCFLLSFLLSGCVFLAEVDFPMPLLQQ